jgi:hypothetical protein
VGYVGGGGQSDNVYSVADDFCVFLLYCVPSRCSGTCAKRIPFFPTRPSTMQYCWLRYVCEQCGAGPAFNYSDPAHQSPPHPSTMQYYWLRYVCEQGGAGPVACNYSDPARHSPPRPSTIRKYWLRYVCEKNTVLFHPALPP